MLWQYNEWSARGPTFELNKNLQMLAAFWLLLHVKIFKQVTKNAALFS